MNNKCTVCGRELPYPTETTEEVCSHCGTSYSIQDGYLYVAFIAYGVATEKGLVRVYLRESTARGQATRINNGHGYIRGTARVVTLRS